MAYASAAAPRREKSPAPLSSMTVAELAMPISTGAYARSVVPALQPLHVHPAACGEGAVSAPLGLGEGELLLT